MSSTPIVLLCGAPGTRLSSTVKSLADGNEIRRWDLEKRLARHYGQKYREYQPGASDEEPDEDQESTQYSMYIVARRPRRELYKIWRTYCNTILSEISDAGSADVRLLCMHLTWYHPETREFFSPVNLQNLQDKDCPITHIVILIDDIYDMYQRLRKPLNLYDKRAHQILRDGFAKLSGDNTKIDIATVDLESLEDEQKKREKEYRVQGIELALGELMAWRRAEMIYAENIARTLKCDLTVFGIKHSRESLEHLVRHPRASRIYLSHRITELRKANKASRKSEDDHGRWAVVAREVNRLHRLFIENDQILINPTAIDELRYDNLLDGGGRNPMLTPRWPLPTGNILYEKPPSNDYQFLELLVGGLPLVNSVSSSAARTLSNRIFSEISFRDHVIVENTPNLCVFRPFYCTNPDDAALRATWSGGVGPEVEHWQRYSSELSQDLEDETPNSRTEEENTEDEEENNEDTQRKTAFVNSLAEIEGRIKYLTHSADSDGRDKSPGRIEFEGAIVRHMQEFLMDWTNHLKSPFPKNQRQEYDNARVALFADQRGSTHLRSGHMPAFMQYYPSLLYHTVHFSFFAAFYHAFTTMQRPQRTETEDVESDMDTMSEWIKAVASSSSDVGFFTVEESQRRVRDLDGLATRLCRFFAIPEEGTVGNHIDDSRDRRNVEPENEEFWRVCVEQFEKVTEDSIGAFAAGTVGVNYEQLCGLLKRPPLTL